MHAAFPPAPTAPGPCPPGAGTGRALCELMGALWAPDPAAELARRRERGDWHELWPELVPSIGFAQRSRFHAQTVDEHLLACLDAAVAVGADERLRLAALLHDAGKPAAAWTDPTGRLRFGADPDRPGHRPHETEGALLCLAMLGRLGAEPHTRRTVAGLVAWHMPRAEPAAEARALSAALPADEIGRLLALRRCDCDAKRLAPRPRRGPAWPPSIAPSPRWGSLPQPQLDGSEGARRERNACTRARGS